MTRFIYLFSLYISLEQFEEIDTSNLKPKVELKENVSLLDRGKGIKKQVSKNIRGVFYHFFTDKYLVKNKLTFTFYTSRK